MSLYKRDPSNPGAPYYICFIVGGKRYRRSAETSNRRLAEQRERAMRSAVLAGKWAVLDDLKARGSGQTFGDLFAIYDRVCTRPESTKRRNKSALRRMLDVTDDDPLTRLNEVDDLETTHVGDKALAGLNEEQRNSRRISYNSRLRQAQSIFSARYLLAYVKLGVTPDIRFMGLRPVRFVKSPWSAPSHHVLERLSSGLAELEKQGDPVAMVVILAANAGLRPKEILHARWAWLGSTGIRIAPDREFSVKGFASRVVPLTEDTQRRLYALRQSTDYMVPGANKTQRANTVQRDAPKWLRDQGMTDRKPLHALRKLFGSAIATTQGLYPAQRALGHSDPSVTNSYYADLLTPVVAVSPLSPFSSLPPQPCPPLPAGSNAQTSC